MCVCVFVCVCVCAHFVRQAACVCDGCVGVGMVNVPAWWVGKGWVIAKWGGCGGREKKREKD